MFRRCLLVCSVDHVHEGDEMAGQGDDDRDSAGTRVRDGIIDARADRTVNRNVGAPPPIVGGGGDNGGFFFTNLGDLDKIIKQLMSMSDRAYQHSQDLRSAKQAIRPPAEDTASRDYAKAVQESLTLAVKCTSTLRDSLKDYIEKLNEAKSQMARTDQGNAGALTPTDRG
jgi:hypothetical protein